jgi:hypothetical protein
MRYESCSYECPIVNLFANEDHTPMTKRDWKFFLSSIEYDPDELVEHDTGKPLAVPIQYNGLFINQPKGEAL